MKSSIVPYAAGAMTVLGVWLFASNKQKIDKLVKNVSETITTNKSCYFIFEKSINNNVYTFLFFNVKYK